MELVQAFVDAGLPDGVLNMVTGVPDQISRRLLGSPVIRKLSFTGSTNVGKHLIGLTTTHLQVPTMELGGHAPVIVSEDVDVEAVADALVAKKLQNGGQVCLAPTRFYIQSAIYERFVDRMSKGMSAVKIGNGMSEDTELGPMVNAARVEALEAMTKDAVDRGARLVTGGRRIGNKGFFFEPTVLADVPDEALIMNEEPFGPIVPCQSYSDLDEAIAKANALPYGLNAYAFATSRAAVQKLGSELQSGIVSINRTNAVYTETPMGGVKSSGYGKELGSEGIDAFIVSKFISENDPMSSSTMIAKRG
jgi:succinate-semialdehyde dehydrogenase/glutarate-semialdehyde dehydrogenase